VAGGKKDHKKQTTKGEKGDILFELIQNGCQFLGGERETRTTNSAKQKKKT